MKKKKRITRSPTPTTKKKIQKSSIPTAMEYLLLFNTCVIDKDKLAQVDKAIDENVTVNRNRYENISSLVRLGNGNLFPPANNGLFASSYTSYFERFNAGSLVQSPFGSALPGHLFDTPPAPGGQAGVLAKNFFDGTSLINSDVYSPTNFFGGGASIPWYFIACVHYLECAFSFKKHLHNGDPLTGYTVQVPAHRPKVGHGPPFTFEESAVDALKLMKYDKVTNWSLPFILQKLEGYNGFGYAKKGIHTPYLWSFSNHYTKGKYVKDGVFSADAVSQQLGAAVILKRMEDRAIINIPRS